MSRLRDVLEDACAAEGLGLRDFTVLAPQNDPFRVDTPAGHRGAAWLAMYALELDLGSRVIHLRGVHYMLVSAEAVKPDGSPYTNTDRDWAWLVNNPAKAVRWLGYLPFEQFKDARSTPPVLRPFEREAPYSYLYTGVEVEIPVAADLEPEVLVDGFVGRQPFKFVLFGEKTSLEDVLDPIAAAHEADLYLPAGEISDSFLYAMAKSGAEDGRSMVVFAISDCDPAGLADADLDRPQAPGLQGA